MKILAMYLPQFHRVKENDEWWGKGFTEWVAVKNAKSLYEGHLQPHVPNNGWYYDLLEKETMEKQAQLVTKAGLDGICIYHYWFEKGRRILENPEKNLLRWKEIELPFCFSWANETWARTWSNLTEKNTWTSEFETERKYDDIGILLNQKYGFELDWTEHFNYLLPFFKDKRYLKIDGKPIFVIHKCKDIYCLDNMLDLWNELAKKNGLDGIYIIGNSIRESQKEACDEIFVCEPGEAMIRSEYVKRNNVRCFDYDEIWESILNRKNEENVSIGAYTGYDDTPRHGIYGSIIENASPQKFEKYISRLIKKNIQNNAEVMFINAWNEWGEGMYLEPDEIFHDDYINALNRAVHNFNSDVSSIEFEKATTISENTFNALLFQKEHEQHLKTILDRWMGLKELNVKLFDSLRNKKIMVYGYGLLGKHLLQHLLTENIKPVCIIDRNPNVICSFPVYSPEDEWPNGDLIIVSATFDYGYIYRKIKKKMPSVDVVSLEHIIMEK